jgi:hypothetical protein
MPEDAAEGVVIAPWTIGLTADLGQTAVSNVSVTVLQEMNTDMVETL